MNIENSRRGACDRCRGQKLRCVGLANPIFNPGSRFQRNGIPCERCKRAKVECYSVRPAPRKVAVSDSSHDKRAVGTQSCPERPPLVVQHQRSPVPSQSTNQAVTGSKSPQNSQPINRPQRSNSANSHNGQQSHRQGQDVEPLSTLATPSSEWMTHLQDDDMDWNDVDLGTPIWMLDSDLNSCQDSVVDSLGDYSMVDLTSKATSVERGSGQFDIDASFGQTGSTHHASSETQKQSSPDHRTNSSSQTRRSPHRLAQNLESTKSCIQELGKLNEMLLHEKSSLEDASTQKGLESGQRSIGQSLHHCQDFLSILRRLKSSRSTSNSNERYTASKWSYSGMDKRLDDGTHIHPLSPQSNSSNAAQSHSHSGSSDISSPRRFLSTPLTPAAPPLEIPVLLSILSCYAYILQSYDNLFTPILDALTQSTPTVPATLTGLRLDGFGLDGHNTLQLECLINVSFNMLDKIENILIGSPGYGGLFSQARGGLLGDKLFAGLIDALYDQNEQTPLSHSNGKREVRAKRLIREIQAALKVIDL
ncbi:hypothetical protein K432DRAFT_420312 [Lepidopterella palustris CBS 459.81]|uniref:Zn(2)-C6 fungal-type domain-containing protein n=1 Tax=Lepidopterella palustris CBS 459.81 TaxID=1314670 RepID=A0A8E2J9L3_9PEZI|nr:hypothetical protein K432DRAFT_420312 [Lepidopterella palustris CBS 459.81]